MYCTLLYIIINLSFTSGLYFTNRYVKNYNINDNKKYHISKKYYEQYIRRLNSKNITIQNQEILKNDDPLSQSTSEMFDKTQNKYT